MAQYLMQARSSTSGLIVTWVTSTPDFAGSSFPGPGSPLDIAATQYGSSSTGDAGPPGATGSAGPAGPTGATGSASLGPTIANSTGGNQASVVTRDGSSVNADLIRFTFNGTTTVQGLKNGIASRRVRLSPATDTTVLLIENLSGSAATGEKIVLPAGTTSPVTVPANAVAVAVFDATDNIWRLESVGGGGGSITVPGTVNQVLESDGAGGIIAVNGTEVAGSPGDVQVQAPTGGGLAAVPSGTAGYVLTSIGPGLAPVYSPPAGGGGTGEVSMGPLALSGDTGMQVLHEIDPSTLADGIYELTARLRADVGPASGNIDFYAIGMRCWFGVTSGAINTIQPVPNEVLYQRYSPLSAVLATMSAEIHHQTSPDKMQVRVRGEATTDMDVAGERDLRQALKITSTAGGWHGAGGSPPTISSLNYAQGDTIGGGQSIVVTGTNLASASAVDIGGTAQTITGTTSTTVTFTLAARAAGSGLTLTVTTPGGTATTTFEYWDPSVPGTLTEGMDKGYTASLPFTPRFSSAGTFTTAGSNPTASSGDMVFAGAQLLHTPAINALMTTASGFGANKGTCVAVLKASAAATHTGGSIDNPAICCIPGGSAFNVFYDSQGFTCNVFDASFGAARESHVAMGHDSLYHIGIARFQDGVDLSTRVDGSSWDTQTLTNFNDGQTAPLILGVATDVVTYLNNANLAAILWYSDRVTDANGTKLYKWAQQHFGVV